LAFLGILILRVLFFIINPDWGEFGSQFWYYLSFSFLFSYVAIAGYTNVIKHTTLSEVGQGVYTVFRSDGLKEAGLTAEESVNHSAPKTKVDESPTEPVLPTKKEANKKPLDEAEISEWKEKLQRTMNENRLYENPRLTLTDVAQELLTNTKFVSTIVNQGFQMNFNDYVNQFRVEAVKQRLKEGEHISKTLLGVALDCGFNSKATFNRAFKKNTSISPQEYLNTLTKE
jgi:AraC-like DNA-binding protein